MEEFKNDEVGLVVKTNFAKNSTPDREDCLTHLNALLSEFDQAK